MNVRTIALAVIALVLVGVVSGVVTIATIAHTINDSAAEEARVAPEIFATYRAKHRSIADAMPDIAQHLQRTGLYVWVLDQRNHTAYGEDGRPMRHGPPPFQNGTAANAAPPPPFARGRARPDGFNNVSMLIGWAAGARFYRIPVDDAEIFVSPDIRPIVDVFRLVVFAFLAFFVIVGMVLWWYARTLRRQALHAVVETTASLRRLAARDFTPRTIVTGDRREYGDLARAYNDAGAAVAAAFAERQAAEREMQRFIADAGHELRTPLTIVMGYVDVLDGGALSDRSVAERVFNGMRTEARRMRRLIDKLIVLARMETPQSESSNGEVDVAELTARIVESFETLGGRPIHVEGPRHAFAHADEGELDEAITNIIENALKYAPDSDVFVRIAASECEVSIAIADQGPGMTADDRRNAFERFYRGERRGEVAGSGLGLAIAKRALDRCGGSVTLESAPGAGTTLTIVLPATQLGRYAAQAT